MNARTSEKSKEDIAPGGATIDFARGEIRFADGQRSGLSERERQLLQYFIGNAGRVISRDEILARVWRLPGRRIITRVIDMHVAHLRGKLKNSRALRTIYGQGYMFVAEMN